MRWFCIIISIFFASHLCAEILVPVRTIRAKEIIGPSDVIEKSISIDGAILDLSELVGKEARIALYPGRPIRRGDVRPPAVISRNELVGLVFSKGGLRIMAEGRSLGRGAVGEVIRVMNIASRTTVSGRILPNGSVEVR